VTDLYQLLPRIHQERDAERGSALRAFLSVIEEQRGLLSDEIDQLYDDWFIETCQEWLVPYLGELVGYRLLHGYEEVLGSGTDAARQVLRAIAPRREVADTIHNRRRKGTLAILEDLAADIAAWPARAVEFRTLLRYDQPVRLFGSDPIEQCTRLLRGRLVDVHDGERLDRVDTAFDELAHGVDVRRISSRRGVGWYGIEDVGLFVWRLGSYSVTHAPAYCDDRERMRFTFSLLGNDSPLVVAPVREPTPTHIADETNVPAYIRRQAFERNLLDYYGPGKSLCIWVGDDPEADLVPASQIVAADLSDWTYRPLGDQVAVDPVRGRIAFSSRRVLEQGVWVSYRYAFSADIGGGEYQRPDNDPGPTVYPVGPGRPDVTIPAALARWQTDKQANDAARQAIVELFGSGEFVEPLDIALEAGDQLTIRAAPGCRPVIRLLDWYANRSDALVIRCSAEVDGGARPTVVLDGLLVAGRGVRVQGTIAEVTIRDCTLVPGWSLDADCECRQPEEPSIELDHTTACLQISRSIVGTIRVVSDEVRTEPNQVFVSDSVVDACSDDLYAVCGADDGYADAVVSIRKTTVIGRVRSRGVGLVENAILTAPVEVVRRQNGCLRFSWVHPDSQAPRQFHCEPAHSGDPVRVVPGFTSRRYGTPGYAQLDRHGPVEIERGAEDGSEMGVFHDLYQPQRFDNLTLRLADFTPAGTDAGIVFVT
jgi:hypothetical protein